LGYRSAIHVNPALAHQVRIGSALHAGIPHTVLTDSPDTVADTHIVLGPWFALDKWRHAHSVLYIDRAYWGDPDSVSVHWLKNGEKVCGTKQGGRDTPAVLPYRQSQKRIYLCDYGQEPEGDYDAVRYHPADGSTGTLQDALEGYGIALGRRTTALLDAAIAGLQVITTDGHSPVWPISGRLGGREQLLRRLAWHNWTIDEITRGLMWEHLSQR